MHSRTHNGPELHQSFTASASKAFGNHRNPLTTLEVVDTTLATAALVGIAALGVAVLLGVRRRR